MRRLIFLIALLVVGTAIAQPAAADRRVALIIGNGKYVNEAPLANPGNDARDVSAALKRIGFDDVQTVLDGDLNTMQSALGRFAKASDGADLALIYYSGHGIEVDGRNYLIPTGAKLADASDVEFETVPLDLAVAAADRASKVKLIVLDACRNNPFQARMARRQGKRSVGRGFAIVAPTSGMLVAYAAKAGTVADDGPAGSNSPFTKAFLQFVEQPKVEVRLLFGRIRDEVVQATRSQEPFTYGSLGGKEVFLNPGTAQVPVPLLGTGPAAEPKTSEAAQAWKLVENSTDEWLLEAFIRRYGDTFYGDAAKGRLAEIRRQKTAKPAEPTPPPGQARADPPQPQVQAKAAPPKVAAAEPVRPKSEDKLPANPAAASAIQQATATCKRLIDDPIETIVFPVMLSEGRVSEDYIHALAYELRHACRIAAAAQPADLDLQLFALVTEVPLQILTLPPKGGSEDLRALVTAALAKGKPLVERGHPNAVVVKAAALLLLAELERDRGAPKVAGELEAAALRLAQTTATSPWAMATLAWVYAQRRSSLRDTDQGLKWLRAAADKGIPNLAAGIGLFMSDSPDFDKPEIIAEGRAIMLRALERGSNIARLLVSELHAKGTGVPINKEEAVNLLNQLGKHGSPAAQLVVAGALLGKNGPPPMRDILPADQAAGNDLVNAAGERGDGIIALAAADLSTGEQALKWYRRASQIGNPMVLLEVAERYAAGDRAPLNQEEAMRLVQQAAEAGDAWVALRAAGLLAGPLGLAAPAADHIRLLKLAAGKGDPEVTFSVALRFLKGEGIGADAGTAASLLSVAAQSADAGLTLRIAETFRNEGKDLPQAAAELRRLLIAAAGKDDAAVVLKVADMFARGEGVAKDGAEAARLYRLASGMEADGVTLLRIAEMFAKGEVLPQSRTEASRLYRLAAEKGDAEVALEVARVFGEGRGVYVNQVEAAKWLKAAAESGLPKAVLAAAEAYADGRIVAKSADDAQRLFKRAVEIAGSDATIQHAVALRFLKGDGVARDEAEGLRLLHAAAVAGYSAALEQLAEVYDKGQGAPRDGSRAANFALQALKKRGALPSSLFDAYSTSFSAEFRRAMQAGLKSAGQYQGAIDGNFGPAVRRALEAYAKP